MAKLSAHGKELARFSVVNHSENGMLSETYYAVFEDRWILKKLKIFQDADMYTPARWHSYGWKRFRKIKEGRIDAVIEKMGKSELTRL